MPKNTLRASLAVCLLTLASAALADRDHGDRKWAASWTTAPVNVFKGVGSVQTAALVNFAFPPATPTPQAVNQTLRMIVKPDIWASTMRVRLSNTWGTGPVTFGRVAIGLQSFSGATVSGTNRVVTFGGKTSVTLAQGEERFSDAVHVEWAHSGGDDEDEVNPAVEGRNLAISMFIHGSSGPITTPGNNDRFLNWMSRRLHEAFGQHVSVVNEGIGGDTAAAPLPGQTRPLLQVLPERFSRDILGVSGITDVVFYAGTNDFGDKITPEQSIASLTSMVGILHARGIN